MSVKKLQLLKTYVGSLHGNVILVGVFLCTLQSFYFPLFGPVFTFLGFSILLLFSLVDARLRFTDTKLFLLLAIASLFSTLISSFSESFSVKELFTTLATVTVLIGMPFILSLYRRLPDEFRRALKITLITHSMFIVLQFLYWLVLRDYLDLLNILVGLESGSFSKKGIRLYGEALPRFSGIFNEPGTYSVTILSIAICYYRMVRQLDWVIKLSIATSLITMSAFAYVLGGLILVVVALDNRKSLTQLGLFTVISISALFSVGVIDSLISRFSEGSTYSGIGFRQEMFNFLFSDMNILNGVRLNDYPDYFVVNDLGVWFSLIASYGILGAGMLVACILYVRKESGSNLSTVAFGVILLTKLKYSHPLFWLLFILMATASDRGLKRD